MLLWQQCWFFCWLTLFSWWVQTKCISYKSSHRAFAALWWQKVIWAFLFNVRTLQVLLNCHLPASLWFCKTSLGLGFRSSPLFSPISAVAVLFEVRSLDALPQLQREPILNASSQPPTPPPWTGWIRSSGEASVASVLTSSAGILTHTLTPLCLSLLWTRFTASAIMVKLVDLLVRIFLNVQDKTHRLLTKYVMLKFHYPNIKNKFVIQ